ncbi:MAG: hypothetical protein QOE09_2384 [Ilumatobacteraceae bacterium]
MEYHRPGVHGQTSEGLRVVGVDPRFDIRTLLVGDALMVSNLHSTNRRVTPTLSRHPKG